MGDADSAWAEGMRRAHYPPDRNLVPAHVTLFRHLPPSIEAELMDRLGVLARQARPAARLAGVMSLGRGVAYRVESPGLMEMRDELAQAFRGLLMPQDLARPRLHITVQNKVDGERARALAAALMAGFTPRPLVIAGLAAWRYRDGPWDAIGQVRFRG